MVDNRSADEAVRIAALGEAAWHAEAYAALGVPWHEDDGVAWRTGASHPFLLAAVTTAADASSERVARVADEATGSVVVRDSFDRLDLAPYGYRSELDDPWMLRPPSAFDEAAEHPAGLTIRRAASPDEVEEFERTAFVANGDLARWVPGALHPRDTTLGRPNLHLYVARMGAHPVGTALAVVCPAGVTVSGVAVTPAYRRRGIGATLVRRCLETAPDRPATLTASDLGIGTYRRLGFLELPRPRHWTRVGT